MGLATDHAYAPAAAAPSSPQPADHQALRVLLAELARSEERYALAIRAANDGIWDWDLVSNTLYLSSRWHAILGRPQPEDDLGPTAWFDLVHPSDLGRLRATVTEHLEGRSPQLRAEHRKIGRAHV